VCSFTGGQAELVESLTVLVDVISSTLLSLRSDTMFTTLVVRRM
jgi:hypothetical protein